MPAVRGVVRIFVEPRDSEGRSRSSVISFMTRIYVEYECDVNAGVCSCGMRHIHFAHANSFPSMVSKHAALWPDESGSITSIVGFMWNQAYSKVLRHLQGHHSYKVSNIPMIGHSEQFPVTDSWPHLVKELIHSIEQKHVPGKVIAVGHSLGGYLSFLASRQRPDLFHSVIMLDSPVMPPWRAHIFAAMKRVGLDDLVTPARASRKRRQEWANVAEAYRFFKSKPAFALWDDDCLRDYVEHGTLPSPCGGKRRLLFDPSVELSIYRSIPHTLHQHAGGEKGVPTAFVGGTRSLELRLLGGTGFMERGLGFEIVMMEGTHLFPFETPIETADMIARLIEKMHIEERDR